MLKTVLTGLGPKASQSKIKNQKLATGISNSVKGNVLIFRIRAIEIAEDVKQYKIRPGTELKPVNANHSHDPRKVKVASKIKK